MAWSIRKNIIRPSTICRTSNPFCWKCMLHEWGVNMNATTPSRYFREIMRRCSFSFLGARPQIPSLIPSPMAASVQGRSSFQKLGTDICLCIGKFSQSVSSLENQIACILNLQKARCFTQYQYFIKFLLPGTTWCISSKLRSHQFFIPVA